MRELIQIGLEDPGFSNYSAVLNKAYSYMVILSLASMIVGSFRREYVVSVWADLPRVLDVFDMVFNGLFTFELVLRAYAADYWRVYISNFYTWVDLFAVLPFFIVGTSLNFTKRSDGNIFAELLYYLGPTFKILKLTRVAPESRLLLMAFEKSKSAMKVGTWRFLGFSYLNTTVSFPGSSYLNTTIGFYKFLYLNTTVSSSQGSPYRCRRAYPHPVFCSLLG